MINFSRLGYEIKRDFTNFLMKISLLRRFSAGQVQSGDGLLAANLSVIIGKVVASCQKSFEKVCNS